MTRLALGAALLMLAVAGAGHAQTWADRARVNYENIAAGRTRLADLSAEEQREVAELDGLLRGSRTSVPANCRRPNPNRSALEKAVDDLKCSGYPKPAAAP